MLRKKRIYLVPILIFLIIIILGAIILHLPICNNKPISFLDSLFMSASGICVNGFSTVNVSEQFTLFGQIILAILTEIGALGFMSIVMFILSLRNRKVDLFKTMLAGDSINENIYANVKQRSKNICKYTFIIEFIGALLLSVRFIPMFGVEKGIWYSVFHSITAFCNAGFDLFGTTSLNIFKNDVYINIIFMTLIILGGIGFFVIEDILIHKKGLKKIQFQSKIVLSSTAILLILSIFLIKIMEPNFTILNSAFTAVTLRTAGFSTVNIANCNLVTKLLFIVLMFIGGAPGSTSGGIRIVVFAILILTTSATLRNKRDIIVFNKRINHSYIRKSVTIVVLSLVLIFVSIIAFMYLNNIGSLNIIFHCFSTFSAVGLGLVNASILNAYGKIITIILMFIGRVGPIAAISLFLIDRKTNENIIYPDGNLML